MAFRATAVIAEQAFDRIRVQVSSSKDVLTRQRALMVLPSVSAQVPFAVIQHLAFIVPVINALAATPGLAQYAKDQVNDPAYDIAAEFTAMRNAMVLARDNLIALFPKDGSGFLLYQTLNADGTVATRNFTAAQVSSAVPLIDDVLSTIS